MIPVMGWVAIAAWAAGVLVGGVVCADWYGPKQYHKGVAAGVSMQYKIQQTELEQVRAEVRAQAQEEIQKASGRANEIMRIQRAAIESARVEYAQAVAAAGADADRLLQRLRLAQARSKNDRADGCGRVSEAAGASLRNGEAAGTWRIPEGAGEHLVRLAARAESLANQYRVCYEAFPRNPPP